VKKSSTLKSALVVVGGSLAAVPATALELGDVKVHSTLGQPLRASIAYALGPNEALSDTCVTLQPGNAADGLPSVDRASMIVSDGVIAITGRSVIREPLLAMRLNVRCQYTAQLTRDYMMFIDPAGTAPQPEAVPLAAAPAPRQTAAPVSRPARTAVRRPAPDSEPIAGSGRYQVQPGDSLSEIAQRIQNRPVGLWNAVNAIFDANPEAFIDNDPNKLKAGSWLVLPEFASGETATVAEVATATSAPAEPTAASSAYEPAAADDFAAAEAAPADVARPLANLKPGDVVPDSENPFVEPAESAVDMAVIIPDTALEGPATTSNSPNVAVATIQTAAPTEPGNINWMLWLSGGGIAIILGMLLFGRRFAGRFGSTPIGAPAVPQRRRSDTAEVEAISDLQLDIPDDSPTEENLALDADLIVGTGLQEGVSVDLAQDFGFASTPALDMELPEEMSSGGTVPDTDIIPPFSADVDSILESEVLPEDDDYDMSVIVDATKMPHHEDVTEKDLEVVQVDPNDESMITGDYTLDQDVDYTILEQDYEDEMTATQALSAEIQKAAEDLAVRMDDDLDGGTTEMPLATVHELDVTAQLPATNRRREEEEISDDDDTGVNPTVNMDATDKTVEMTQENTVEMPRGGSKAG